jgi:O-antigen ligase
MQLSQTFSEKLELISKLSVVATAFCLPLSTTLTDILFVLTPVLYFSSGAICQKLRLVFAHPLSWIFLAFFSLLVFGCTYTTVPLLTALRMLGKYDKFFWAIFFIPIFTEQRVRRLSLSAFVLAVGIMLFASFLKAAGLIHYEIANGGPVEVFKGHIAFSFLLAFTAYLIMIKIDQLIKLMIDESRAVLAPGVRVVRSRKYFELFFFLLLLGLIMYNLFFLTLGRAGYFIFAGLLLLFFLQKLRSKGILIALFGLAISGALLFNFSPRFKERINAIATEVHDYQQNKEKVETSVGLRISFWENSWRLLLDHPVFGTGTGSFAHEYANLKPTPHHLIDNPHNEYLNIGVQLGLIGVGVMLLMFGWQLQFSRLLPDRRREIAQAVVLSIMLGSLANSWLMDTTEGHFYVYFVVLTFAAFKKSSRVKGTGSR